jgi:hypothetical protein
MCYHQPQPLLNAADSAAALMLQSVRLMLAFY